MEDFSFMVTGIKNIKMPIALKRKNFTIFFEVEFGLLTCG
jgi:hypothetical protein